MLGRAQMAGSSFVLGTIQGEGIVATPVIEGAHFRRLELSHVAEAFYQSELG